MAAKFGVFVDETHDKLPSLYWLPKLHKLLMTNESRSLLIVVHVHILSCLDF